MNLAWIEQVLGGLFVGGLTGGWYISRRKVSKDLCEEKHRSHGQVLLDIKNGIHDIQDNQKEQTNEIKNLVGRVSRIEGRMNGRDSWE